MKLYNTINVSTAIQLATTQDQIRACYSVMRQLRPHLDDEQAFVEQVVRQIEHGYHLAFCLDKDGIQALLGFRVSEFLAWGKVLYIDDLITNREARKKGHSSQLLKWVLEKAKSSKCDQVHLDSGPQRHDAHRLYLNHGFKIIGYHFALDLIS